MSLWNLLSLVNSSIPGGSIFLWRTLVFLVDPGVLGEKKCPWRTLVSLIDPKSLEDTSVPGENGHGGLMCP